MAQSASNTKCDRDESKNAACKRPREVERADGACTREIKFPLNQGAEEHLWWKGALVNRQDKLCAQEMKLRQTIKTLNAKRARHVERFEPNKILETMIAQERLEPQIEEIFALRRNLLDVATAVVNKFPMAGVVVETNTNVDPNNEGARVQPKEGSGTADGSLSESIQMLIDISELEEARKPLEQLLEEFTRLRDKVKELQACPDSADEELHTTKQLDLKVSKMASDLRWWKNEIDESKSKLDEGRRKQKCSEDDAREVAHGGSAVARG